MDLTPFTTENPAIRRDGWSPELKVKFLDHLAAKGTVGSACSLVGMSREAAYRLRRRDTLFARGWDAALVLARDSGCDLLACHAIDGVEEEVWHRGEHVGTRIRHDTRLLLAHLARLDRLVDASRYRAEDAGRFDELLALIGGEEPPEDVEGEEVLQFTRVTFVENGEAAAADEMCREEAAEGDDQSVTERKAAETAREWGAEAAAQWDDWFQRACARVDQASDFSPRTVSTVSTSGEGEPLRHGEDRTCPHPSNP